MLVALFAAEPALGQKQGPQDSDAFMAALLQDGRS
jgi:hypothetical protein